MCEEFGCLPSAAVHEPLQLALDILDLRAYARTKTQIDQARDDSQVPQGEVADWVWQMTHEQAQAARNQKPTARPAKRSTAEDSPAGADTSLAARESTATR